MDNDPTVAELYRLALDAALNCNWEKAIELNLKLQQLNPEKTDCLNRLAKAHFELGNYSQAKKLYQEVLDLDPYNSIAQKNLKKVSLFKKNNDDPKKGNGFHEVSMLLSPSLFVEEPGVTKIVNLVKVAEPQKLLTLSSGTLVTLVVKKRGIVVYDMNNTYLGALPDDSAHHMQKLIKGGNKYQIIIKSVKQNGLAILIREVYRSKKFKNQASFLEESKFLAFSSDNISLSTDRVEDDSDQQPDREEIVN